MKLRDFLLTLLLPAGFLWGGSCAQPPEIITQVSSAEGKPGMLSLPGISREACLLFPSRADAYCCHTADLSGRLGLLRRAV